VLQRTFERTRNTRQQVGWLSVLRGLRLSGPNALGFYAAIGAVALVAVIGLGIWSSSRVGPGGLPSASPSPTESPGPTARPLRGNIVEAGAWFVDIETVRIAFDLPAGWEHGASGDLNWLLPPTEGPALLLVTAVTNVLDSPCGDLRIPAVGPSVDDLVTALTGITGLESSVPTDATVSGFRGKQFSLTAPDAPIGRCGQQIRIWTNGGTSVQSYLDLGEVTSVWVVDVDGTRLLIRTMDVPGTTADQRAATQEIFDSIRLGPVPAEAEPAAATPAL